MILSLNTSTSPFSVAVVKEDGSLVAEILVTPPSKGFGAFMPSLHQLLQSAGVTLRDLKAVAVATGPGSFTGLRVGLAAAKGICHGLSIPAVGVSSLEALAVQCPFTPLPVCPVIDSRKGEVFTAVFQILEGGEMSKVRNETCLRLNALSDFVETRALVLGHSYARQADPLRKALGFKALFAPVSLWNLRAAAVAEAGLKKAAREGYEDPESLAPSYLRPPDIREGTSTTNLERP